MKKFLMIAACVAAFGCELKEVARVDFDSVRAGELPFGWIVTSFNKSFPAIWEVNEKKQLYIKYPRGYDEKEFNIFFTKDYYLTNGAISAKIAAKKSAGLIFRARDRKHFISATIDFAKKQLLVQKVDGKKAALLLRKNLPLQDSQADLKAVFCNQSITLYLDGKKIASINDEKPLQGGFGVVALGESRAVFDDIVIEAGQ